MSVERECLRCGDTKMASSIGMQLFNFVCDGCRKDDAMWDFNARRGYSTPITVEAMELAMVVEHALYDPEDDQAEWPSNTKVPKNLYYGKITMSESIVRAEHKGHNVLGDYCWNCRVRTSNRVVGWSHGTHNKQLYRVTWADNTKDDSDRCDECSRHDCKYPVHRDKYKEINKKGL